MTNWLCDCGEYRPENYTCKACGKGMYVEKAVLSLNTDKPDSSYADILEECASIAREREPKYGDATLNMKRIAAGSNLRRPWLNLTPHDIPFLFGVTKDERDFTFLQDDNPLDKACYAGIEVATRRKGMTKPVHYVPPTWFNVQKTLLEEIIFELASHKNERSDRLIAKLNAVLTDYVLFSQ